MNQMDKFLRLFLDHLDCSSCHDYTVPASDISTQEKKEEEDEDIRLKGWNLYIKEFESFSSFILYHPHFQKDILQIFPKREQFELIDDLGNTFIVLEYVDSIDTISVLVPTEKYESLYERLMEKKKVFDKNQNAYFIGSYHLRFL